jgi:hypothetical protein
MNTSIATIAPEARVAKLSELQAKIATRLQARALVLTEEVMQNMPEYACPGSTAQTTTMRTNNIPSRWLAWMGKGR